MVVVFLLNRIKTTVIVIFSQISLFVLQIFITFVAKSATKE